MANVLKLNSPNLVRTPSDAHIFLHFLSHFDKKKIEKSLPWMGFEPTTFKSEGECGDH